MTSQLLDIIESLKNGHSDPHRLELERTRQHLDTLERIGRIFSMPPALLPVVEEPPAAPVHLPSEPIFSKDEPAILVMPVAEPMPLVVEPPPSIYPTPRYRDDLPYELSMISDNRKLMLHFLAEQSEPMLMKDIGKRLGLSYMQVYNATSTENKKNHRRFFAFVGDNVRLSDEGVQVEKALAGYRLPPDET